MTGIRKCGNFPLDKKQLEAAKVPHKPATDMTAPFPCHFNSNLQLKFADWKFWAYTDGSCQAQDGKKL
eukprot:1154293-Pelagomonas_calceolata.AAC.3